jgi:hypothetical protein
MKPKSINASGTRHFTGRPCGDETFVLEAERRIGRHLAPQKPGPKSKPSSPPKQTRLFGQPTKYGFELALRLHRPKSTLRPQNYENSRAKCSPRCAKMPLPLRNNANSLQ